ncbi:MAG: hypothetical protein D6679_11080 [Candidatus Hydrogenedentota bacterium]|nr:MAG: hypothetical protein D6679_11080 [Candidatus Hydrogenedentota bacterium]
MENTAMERGVELQERERLPFFQPLRLFPWGSFSFVPVSTVFPTAQLFLAHNLSASELFSPPAPFPV